MAHSYRSVIVEADGGSRGNPGNAAYGAVLRDADSGAVIAERGERIGVATNNVAEYRGLIAGLHLYREYAEGADLEVRLDSKLVVEQMSGNWKIKHPSMRPLAVEANKLAPFGTRFVWVPREQNKEADRLANEALDGPEGVVVGGPASEDQLSVAQTAGPAAPTPPWLQDAPTTLVLVRHGDTDHTRQRLFSGRTGADPALNDDGRAQIRATAEWLAPLATQSPVLLSSPLRRTRDSAEIVAARLELGFEIDDGLAEAAFGSWEGLSYTQVVERDPEAFTNWLADPAHPAGGSGDSLVSMSARMEETRERLLKAYAGQVVIAMTHLTPIKLLAHHVLEMPLTSLFRTEISPASVTVLAWYPDGRPVVRLLNGKPAGDLFGDTVGVR
jgi:ribonuclease H / adenosylcobalamin/alpha-ribazole phosphatase